jgi:hypothetical protein
MYGFIRRYLNIGIGVESEGFQRPTSLPSDNIYAPRYNVKGQLDPQQPGYLKLAQEFVPVSLLANGVYLQGTLALQALSEFEKAQNK